MVLRVDGSQVPAIVSPASLDQPRNSPSSLRKMIRKSIEIAAQPAAAEKLPPLLGLRW
jgi:hypothetical protein